MNAPAAASRRSPRTDLDALVLEEIEALRRSPPPLRQAPPKPFGGFASDEEFLVCAMRYLAVHSDPGALLARLSSRFHVAAEPKPAGPATTDEEAPAGAGPGEEVPAAPCGPVAGVEEETRP